MSWVTQCSRQCCLGLLVKNVHLILVQAFGTAELQPPLTSTKVQVLLSVANMFAPVTHKHIAVCLEDKPGRVLSKAVLG